MEEVAGRAAVGLEEVADRAGVEEVPGHAATEGGGRGWLRRRRSSGWGWPLHRWTGKGASAAMGVRRGRIATGRRKGDGKN